MPTRYRALRNGPRPSTRFRSGKSPTRFPPRRFGTSRRCTRRGSFWNSFCRLRFVEERIIPLVEELSGNVGTAPCERAHAPRPASGVGSSGGGSAGGRRGVGRSRGLCCSSRRGFESCNCHCRDFREKV